MQSKNFNVIEHEIDYITNNRFIEAWELRQSIGRAINYTSKEGGIENCSALLAILSHFGNTTPCEDWSNKWYYPATYADIGYIIHCDEIIRPFDRLETLGILHLLDSALTEQRMLEEQRRLAEQGADERAER